MKPYINESWYVCPLGMSRRSNAGGIVCCFDGSNTIMIALIMEKGYPGFVLPKGGIQPGEIPQVAARREIAEETGLDGLILIGDLGVCERLNFQKTSWNSTQYFLYHIDGTTPTPDIRGECRVEWFALETLPLMFWPEQRMLLCTHSSLIYKFYAGKYSV